MGKNLAAIAATVLFFVLFATSVFGADASGNPAVSPAETFGKSGDHAFGDSFLTWDGEVNLRNYFRLYEAGRAFSGGSYYKAPCNLWMTLKGQLGATADFAETMFRLSLSTGTYRSSTSFNALYGNSANVYPNFYVLSDFSVYIEEAFGLWRASDQTNIFYGRFGFNQTGTYTSPLTYHVDVAADGLGVKHVFMDSKNMSVFSSFHLAWLGSHKESESASNPNPAFRHMFLIGIQPKLNMTMDSGTKLFAGVGFWAITHPNSINELDPAAPPYGKNAASDGGEPVDVNLVLLEAFCRMHITSDLNIWAHIANNVGAGVYPFGIMLGANYGQTAKKGDMAFGATLFYIERNVWYQPFIDAKFGNDTKGIWLSLKYVFASKFTFYFDVAFKNAINAPNDSQGDSFITGQMFIWTGVVIKFDTKPKK